MRSLFMHSLCKAGFLVFVASLATSSRASSSVAEVLDLRGHPALVMLDRSLKNLTKGQALSEGDVVKTGSQDTVALAFQDGSVVDIAANTVFKISEAKFSEENDRQIQLSVAKGSVRAKIKEKLKKKTGYFRIKSKAGTAGVRGTDFKFAVEQSSAKLESVKVSVFEGTVELSALHALKTLMLKAGSQVRVKFDLDRIKTDSSYDPFAGVIVESLQDAEGSKSVDASLLILANSPLLALVRNDFKNGALMDVGSGVGNDLSSPLTPPPSPPPVPPAGSFKIVIKPATLPLKK